MKFEDYITIAPDVRGGKPCTEGARIAVADILEYLAGGDTGCTVVSKDDDFRQLSFVPGAPPKVIWLAIAHAGTEIARRLLSAHSAAIGAFLEDAEASLAVLQLMDMN